MSVFGTDRQIEMMMADGMMALDVEVPFVGMVGESATRRVPTDDPMAVVVPLGVDPDSVYRPLQLDVLSRVYAALDDETLDRIAVRVADLLYARNRSGER